MADSHARQTCQVFRDLTGLAQANRRRLLATIGLTATILLAEAIGGWLTNSLALLSDAGHMFTDLLALVLSFQALRLAERPPTANRTFGFRRAEILSALVNGVILIVVSLVIFYEAYRRLVSPPEVQGLGMLVIAAIGLMANLGGLVLLRGAGENLNIRGALLHVLGDTISSVGVIVAGLVILATGWYLVDPLISIVIGLIIIGGAVRLVNEAVNILMEAAPRNMDPEAVVAAMRRVPGVQDVHDVHIWCLTPQLCNLSSHILIDDMATSRSNEILTQVNRLLAEQFHIQHTTIQFECERCGPEDAVCSLGAK